MNNYLLATLENTISIIGKKKKGFHLLNESVFRQIFIEELQKVSDIEFDRLEIEWNKIDFIIKPRKEDDFGALVEFKYYHHSNSEKFLDGQWHRKGFPSGKNETEFLENIEKLAEIKIKNNTNKNYLNAIKKFGRAYIIVVCREGEKDTVGRKWSYTKSYKDFEVAVPEKKILFNKLVDFPELIYDDLKKGKFNLFGRILEIKMDED